MTSIREFVDISAGHAVPRRVESQDLIGLRETLGTVYLDADFIAQYSEVRRRNPGIVTLGYSFLTGPLRAATVYEQVAYWANRHRCDLGALDWERDSYQYAGQTVDRGIQPIGNVIRGLDSAREHGIDAGLYMSRYLAQPAVVDRLIARRTPFLWIAAYGGLTIPDWIVGRCRAEGVLLFHQYAGDTIDRNRVLVGTLEQLHALAGRPTTPTPPTPDTDQGDPMTNLVPTTCHRVVDLAAGTVLERTPGGPKYTTLSSPATLGVLGATATHFHVADGDAGVYVKRDGVSTRVADINVGK